MKRITTILLWASLFAIGGFYIASSVGWVVASYAVAMGMLEHSETPGAELTEGWRSFTVLDHVIRSVQVLAIVSAASLMILRRRLAQRLVVICFAMAATTVANPKWTVSFLSGISGLELLAVVGLYLHALERKGFLH